MDSLSCIAEGGRSTMSSPNSFSLCVPSVTISDDANLRPARGGDELLERLLHLRRTKNGRSVMLFFFANGCIPDFTLMGGISILESVRAKRDCKLAVLWDT